MKGIQPYKSAYVVVYLVRLYHLDVT